MMKTCSAGDVIFGGKNLVVIAGLCVIENRYHTLKTAEAIKKIAKDLQMPFCFKASYDKANRSSIKSYRGPGIEEGLKILKEVKKEHEIPVLTDVHCTNDVPKVAEIVDIIQIPAFLCRQTDLIIAAARTGRIVEVKKGQFLAPWDVKNIIDKLESAGCDKILMTERGISFGYNNLVVDMRSLAIMRSFGYPVVFDATHSVQLPGGKGDSAGGQREFIAPLARAAVAAGIDSVFIEAHEDPRRAKSDGPNSVPLAELASLLAQLKAVDHCVRKLNINNPDS
ncbi:3-deoxy-8-phosphooctulonate synthase [Candidatus Sumerlaeota bacterium]|nr:3-deoxy-8-phosphooctulonate synthase [Candidatus Sumerlaeota bacterium]